MRGFPTLCLLLATGLFSQVTSIKVNSDGGYELVLAFDENTELPTVGLTRYIENIKNSLTIFSSRLWLTTNSTFYLKSVDILLPSGWDVGSSPSSATTQSYQSADIRISSGIAYPRAENLYSCGQPGNAIELPEAFFEQATSGPYGVHAKSLLHLWALYRFGVHSEHGIPGDSRFPYSVWDRQREELSVTGCSDQPLKGKFVDITNPDAICDSEESASNKNCRFQPDPHGQNASSSLMFFHWLDSVEQFCDSHNHNKHASNQQNAHCDHKSVWEVIRETPDYQAVTSRRPDVPAPLIKFVKQSSSPLFYLLLDMGRIQGSYRIANLIPPLLAQFIGGGSLKPTVTSVGAYPGKNGSPLEELVAWAEIGENLATFHESIGVLLANGSLERDFSRALVAVADEIKQKNHPNGAVVLVVKFGADLESFDTYLPESEVMNALNERNIVLHSIELNFPGHSGVSHLAQVCQGTGGSYTVLDNAGDAEAYAQNVLSFVGRMLETHFSDLDRDWKTLRKATLTTTAATPLPANLKGPLQMFVSSLNGALSNDNFTVTGFNATSGQPDPPRPLQFQLRRTLDWNEGASRHTYRLEVQPSELDDVTLVTLRVVCNGDNCENSMLARGEFTGDGDINNVQVTVQTSVEDNQADLSSGRPISIFAKVTKSGAPVGDAQVIASLKETISSNVTLFQLTDDGEFTPDIQKLDGIYSAYFAPHQDGQYELSVTVQSNPSRFNQAPGSLQDGYFTQLLPIDQEDLGCGAETCEAEKLEGDFSQSVDLSIPFSVIQASEYIPNPTRILTLTAQDKPEQKTVNLIWEAPHIPGRHPETVTSYELRSSHLFELLITDFDNQPIIPIPPTQPPPKLPSGQESVTIPRPTATTYYAIRSLYREKKSVPSNIVEVLIENPGVTGTPSPTPTPTPSPTPTGSPDPSGSPTPPTTSSPPVTGTDEDGGSPRPSTTDEPDNPPPSTNPPVETTTDGAVATTAFSGLVVSLSVIILSIKSWA